jgi:hypothetical protein
VRDPQDTINFSWQTRSEVKAAAPARRSPRFLSIWFRCCHVYGRMYRNADETAYEGRCPSCGSPVHALIGPDGTSRRIFEAR